jgi:6-phosphogluconolactonase (cycloisomerase 2 family)
MRSGTAVGALPAWVAFLTFLAPAASADTPAEFVYVASSFACVVSAFRIDAGTGALVEVTGSPFSTGGNPEAVAVDPSNRFLYVSNNGADTLSVYAIDAAGGLLAVPGSPFPTTTPPNNTDAWSFAVDPTGRFLYATDTIARTVLGYQIDPSTGALSAIAGSPSHWGSSVGLAAGDGPDGLMVDPSSRFLYAANANSSNVSAFSIGADGSVTAVPGSPFAVAFGYNVFDTAIAGTNHDPIFGRIPIAMRIGGALFSRGHDAKRRREWGAPG